MICLIADWHARRGELRATREVHDMREIKPRVLAAKMVPLGILSAISFSTLLIYPQEKHFPLG